MKLAYILLSAWAAAAAPAPKQSDWSSSTIKLENGPLRVLKKGSKPKMGSKSKKDTIEKNLSNNDTNENEGVSCDSKTEETCYDEWYKPVSCSLMSEGGCPCPEGTERCGADPANGCVGYCTDVCCDWTKNEYACYEAWQPYTGFCGTIEDGCSCPEGQTECIKGQGFCSNACCDQTLEEHCYGPNNTSFCASIAAGGCPCPEGQVKCGADLDNSYVGYCTDVCCDQKTEETCVEYDDGYDQPFTNQYCAAIAEGGCPCPGGQEKCGADLANNSPGYCTDVCCNYTTHETCYNPPSCALIVDGGCPCPEGQEKCFADLANSVDGWCGNECCDSVTEETCVEYDDGYDQPFTNQYCAAIAEGGCPCAEGQEKCGVDLANNSPGYCTDVCCNDTTHETCYNPPSCALIVDGGCPCSEGQVKCGADLDNNYAGYCTDVCCDQKTEETCYKETFGCQPSQFCAKIIDGGCPCPENQVKCGQDLDCNIVGWCTDICCDQYAEETCYDYYPNGDSKSYCKAMSEGGCPCPEGQTKCGADLKNNVAGWCINILTDACCDATTEEICYESDLITGEYKASCKAIADGGCPCLEGWEKCGQDLQNNVTGWCINILTDVCCDATTEETCGEFDSITGEYKASCKSIADGGCPCWEGAVRCGADDETGYIGYCSSNICCDFDTQLYCYDEDWLPYCYNSTGVDDIICPVLQQGGCNGNNNNNMMVNNDRKLAQGDNSLVSYLHQLETKYEKLSTINSIDHAKDMYRQTLALKQEIHNVHRIINLHDVLPKQSAVKNRGLNFWAKH